MSSKPPAPELNAVWDGYLITPTGEEAWDVLKVEFGEGGDLRVSARHAVHRGKCDCEGFTHRLDCRHVKMIQHRFPPSDRRAARVAAARFIAHIEEDFRRVSIDGYEFVDGDENRVARVIVRAVGSALEVEGKTYTRLVGMMKPEVLVELRIEEVR